MKVKFLCLIILLLDSFSYGQNFTASENYDARAVAMGQSFVANPKGLVAADNNPATLIGQNGLTAFYNRRNLNWSEYFGNNYYSSFGLSAKTSIGIFAVLYKRFDYSERKVTILNEGVLDVASVKPYYYSFIISYTNNILDNLTVGINLKTLGYNLNIVQGTAEEGNCNTPIIADLGLLYHMNGFINQDKVKDKLNIGASLTNYGTDYRPGHSSLEIYYLGNTPLEKLPRMLKLGFAYQLEVRNDSYDNLFRFVITGEYDNLLNKFSHYTDSQKDYWGVGFEGTFLDILSLRLGGVAIPTNSIFGEKGVLTTRYGAGVNLPLKLVGVKLPVSLSFDYAVIPIHQTNIISNKKKNLDAFNISVSYNNPLF
ncbi:MAG: hypothetical protein C4539_12830 [Ignavibacteriales bacterium]|nr:MAG: hypothetical protein C4539_12830 [Ignavibacteriales bacterium]